MPADLEWKVVYVGSAEDSSRDQVLEDVAVGPVPVGLHRFVLQAPAPNPQLIKNSDLIGVTVILITCSYLEQPFVQVGYYVNNEYSIPFEPENYPNPVDITKLTRSILAQEPRVTRYAIDWTCNPNSAEAAQRAPPEYEAEAEPEGDDVRPRLFLEDVCNPRLSISKGLPLLLADIVLWLDCGPQPNG